MRSILKFLFVLSLIVFGCSSAQAASVSEQINTAIKNGDYAAVQTLVGKNPTSTDLAERTLIQTAFSDLMTKPKNSESAMMSAAMMSGGITPAGASDVAGGLKKIVDMIADKALLVCNVDQGSDQSRLTASTDPTKLANQKAIMAILGSAEAIAQTPVIVKNYPQLLAQIQGETAKCGDEEALLAQRPGSRPGVLPHGRPPAKPPGKKELPSAE